MTCKVYFDLNNHPLFSELRKFNPDPHSIKFETYAEDIKNKDADTAFIFFGTDLFDKNLNDIQTLFDTLKKQDIPFTLITGLSSPITLNKANLCKQCSIDKIRHSVFCLFDYPRLYDANMFNDWVMRMEQLIQLSITPIPVILLTKRTIRSVTPSKLILFFLDKQIKMIDFMFVNPQDQTDVPDNEELIAWLKELYQSYKEINKGKLTCHKFTIRGFKKLKGAKNGQFKDMTTNRVMTSAFGGLVTIPMKECTRCEDCPFKDFYRNRENVPVFKGKHCLKDIFEK